MSSAYYGFIWKDYVLLLLCGFGLITNVLNISVFLSPQLKDISYKMLLIKSLANFFYLLFAFMLEFFFHCIDCPTTFSYSANVYTIGIGFYLNSCLDLFSIQIEIFLLIHVFGMLNNRHFFNSTSCITAIMMFGIVSFAFYIPKPLGYTIILEENRFVLTRNSFGMSKSFQITNLVQESIRFFLIVFVLSMLSIFDLIMFIKTFKPHRISPNVNNKSCMVIFLFQYYPKNI